jgi:MFS family permease
VLLPLLALEAGHSAERIGWFAGSGALAHVVARAFMGLLLRRFPDRVLIAISMITLLASFVVVGGSRSAVAFVAAMSLEGMSRACFWTGIQTHVVRGTDNLGSSLASVTLAGSAGLVAGPALAGICLDVSSSLALGVGMACSVLALVFSLRLRRWPPFDPPVDPTRVRVWKRRPVVIGAVATCVAGSWRGLLGSYVPVALVAGGQSSAGVGLAVALASAANTVAALVLVRWEPRRPDRLVALSCAAVGLGIGLLGVVAGSVVAVLLCLVVSGYGAGLLQVVGSAMAVQGVHPEERGDVLALTGMVRAASIMVSPVTVAAMLPALPLAAALVVVGAVQTVPLPALLVRRAAR